MGARTDHIEARKGACSPLAGSRVTSLSYDGGGAPVRGENIPHGLSVEAFGTLVCNSRVSEVSGRTVADILRLLARTGGSKTLSCTVVGDTFSTRYDVDIVHQQGDAIDVVLVDTTAREGEQRSIESLALELAHRTKNVLAVVLSLATQTARRTDRYEDFKERFLGHVSALSSAHDMIAVTGWQGGSVETIMDGCIDSSDERINGTVSPETGSVMLKPNAVQNMAMIFCELNATCADSDRIDYMIDVKDEGGIDLVWTCKGTHDENRIWTEMLCRYAPIALDGTGMIDYDDDGFQYRLTIGPQQRV